ncbi:hypothetical protein [Falsiroseomonas bella]|uniref:hypothetical protein n=1 Tax=Falsiroseomonas bella TaxID=2184016 RepID=UPI0011B65F0C|nr:hypothetical protein [Falsiroseomonas bella]
MRAADFFAAYDGFGERRAGGEGDVASAAWLCDLAVQAGATARLDPVSFSRFVPGASWLEAGGARVEGLPLFDGGTTGADGVSGALGALGSGATVGFVEMPPRAASLPGNPFALARRDSRHAGIVVALRTRPDSLAPLNAHDIAAPFGPPVLQVAGREAARLAALAAQGSPARLVVQGAREATRSANVRADLPGTAPPLLLLTPRTSWWTSTAERAGGILAWLEALRALAAAPRQRAVVALATCGHEIGHVGAHHAFAAEPELASDSALVIHLGANLGCAEAPQLTVRSNVRGLADRMADALVAAGHPRAPLEVVTGGKANGEAHEIESRGGRYLSLIGENPWFHAPEDRWPMSIDLPRAEAIARAVAAVAVGTAAGGAP